MDRNAIRAASWQLASKLGLPRNDALPLLDNVVVTRSKDEIVDRILAINCVAAAAYGFAREKSRDWARREGVDGAFTETEGRFLSGAPINPVPFMEQIEAMWALCWVVNVVPELDFSQPCSGSFVKLFPGLKRDENAALFRQKASLRPSEIVAAACDAAYCMHWGLTDSGLKGKYRDTINPYVIVQRRKALEWSLSQDDWDDVPLDT